MAAFQPLTQRQYTDAIAAALPGTFDALGHVYGKIAVNGEAEPSISVEMPGMGADLCFRCAGTYSRYAARMGTLGSQASEEDSGAIIKEMAESLAKAYNESFLTQLKLKPAHDAFMAKLEDEGFVRSHTYPELCRADRISENANDEFGLWLTSESGIPGIAVAFSALDETGRITARVTTGIACGGLSGLKDAAVVRLNSDVLRWLKIDDITDNCEDYPFSRSTSFAVDVPGGMFDRAGSGLKSALGKYTDSPRVYAAALTGSPFGAGSILLSRTAMLAAAKKVGAKKSLVVIPVGISSMIFAPADGGCDEADVAEAAKELFGYVLGNTDFPPTALARAFRYDVMMGTLS